MRKKKGSRFWTPYFLHLDAAGKSLICKAEEQTHLGAVSMLCEDVRAQLLGAADVAVYVLLRDVEVTERD